MPILLVAVHFSEMSQFQFSFILKDMLRLNTGISPAFVFKRAKTALDSKLFALCFMDGDCSASGAATLWDKQMCLYARTASDL